MIPQEKTEAVTRGLREAFGVTTFEDIRDLTGTATSDHVYRIVVKGSPFLLRIVRRASDAECHFTCMKAAAEAGLAPQVWYVNAQDKLAITDFVDAAPFALNDALVRIPGVLRRLHALPPFPPRAHHLNTSCTFLLNKGPALDAVLQKFHATNLLPQAEKEEVFARYEEIGAVYSRIEPNMVSSHNDLKPENILFDGQHVWLVDWEAAFRNDRYLDIAMISNFVVADDADEIVFLHEYFGKPPDEYQRARFFLMRQVFHLFFAIAFLLFGPSDETEAAADFRDFHQRLWTGQVNLRAKGMRTAYGRVHWERLLENTRQQRFQEALRIVSQGVSV
jgi:thiamine kinase-like enzyme